MNTADSRKAALIDWVMFECNSISRAMLNMASRIERLQDELRLLRLELDTGQDTVIPLREGGE